MTDKRRILIVEDEADTREILRYAMESLGYETTTVVDGREALQLLDSDAWWDLVLLDFQMPEVHGLDVLIQMRKRRPEIPVIMMTAYATVELIVEATQAGARDFLRKPFSLDIMCGAVRAALTDGATADGATDGSGDRADDGRQPGATGAKPARKPAPQRLNGYEFKPVPLPSREAETERLRVRRAFELHTPRGEKRYCTVDVALFVRELVRMGTGKDYPPTDPIWDTVCERALANHLWQSPEHPVENVPVLNLSTSEMEAIVSRQMAAAA